MITGYFPVTVINGTNTTPDSQIYLFITTTESPYLGVMQFSLSGSRYLGEPVTATSTYGTYTSATAYSYPLSSFEVASPTGRTFYLPNEVTMLSSRMYFSVGEPLNLFIPPNGDVPTPTISTPSDFAYYQLWDKIEFDSQSVPFGTGGGDAYALDMNVTLVDFYGLPLSFFIDYNNQVAPTGATTNYTGIDPAYSRQDVLTTYAGHQAALPGGGSGTWSTLPLIYTAPNGTTSYLRLYATNYAAGASSATNPLVTIFPANYLSNNPYSTCQWLNSVWGPASSAFYQNNSLYIDMTVVGPSAGFAKSEGIGSAPYSLIFTLSHDSDLGPDTTITFPFPTTVAPFYTGDLNSWQPAITYQVPGASATEAAGAILEVMGGAFAVGFFPTASTKNKKLSQDSVQAASGAYFTNNPLLCEGPWFDLYSKALLSLKDTAYQKYYTFPYADFTDTNGSITVVDSPAALPVVYITIASLTGGITGTAPIFADSNLYSVSIAPHNFHLLDATFGTSPTASDNPALDPLGSLFIGVTGGSMYLGVKYLSGPNQTGEYWTTHIAPSIPLFDPELPQGGAMSLTGGPLLIITIGAP